MRAEHRVTEKNGALKWFDQEQWRFDQEKHGFHHEKWLLEDLNPGKNAERDGCKAIFWINLVTTSLDMMGMGWRQLSFTIPKIRVGQV